MQINRRIGILAVVTGTYAASTSSKRWSKSLTVMARATGSGPNGVLTVDHDVVSSKARVKAASVEDSIVEDIDAVYGTCLVPTNTTVSDCQAVLGDIAGNNGTIAIAPGFCLNWWEGGCLGRVCGRNQVFSASSDWIVDTMTDSILDTCIANGETGVAADCAAWDSTCGTYRLFLQMFDGI